MADLFRKAGQHRFEDLPRQAQRLFGLLLSWLFRLARIPENPCELSKLLSPVRERRQCAVYPAQASPNSRRSWVFRNGTFWKNSSAFQLFSTAC